MHHAVPAAARSIQGEYRRCVSVDECTYKVACALGKRRVTVILQQHAATSLQGLTLPWSAWAACTCSTAGRSALPSELLRCDTATPAIASRMCRLCTLPRHAIPGECVSVSGKVPPKALASQRTPRN